MKIFSDDTIKDYLNIIGERNEFDRVVTLPLLVQEILGQNVLNPNWNWKTRMAKQIFIIFLLIYVYFGTKEYLKDATELTEKGEAYYTFSITFFFTLKYLLFINTRAAFRKSYLIAKTSLTAMIRAESIEKSNELFAKLKIVVKILFAGVLLPVMMYLLVALWNYILGTRVTLSKTTSILMPMTSPYYEFGLILHTIYLVEMAFTYCVIDLWFAILMLTFCLASDSLTNGLKVKPKELYETDMAYMDRLNKTLKSFYKNHAILMDYFNITTDMFKWQTGLPLVSTLFAMCLIYLCMSEHINWMFLTNLLPVLIEVFAYNCLGEAVKNKETKFYMALLEFDWASLRLKDKKNYLIIISYMNREFKIKTALGNDLSLVTMTGVFKATYQGLALIRSMET